MKPKHNIEHLTLTFDQQPWPTIPAQPRSRSTPDATKCIISIEPSKTTSSFLACRGGNCKRVWIRLLFAHLFPLNSRDAITSANFIWGCFTTYASWLLHFSCELPTQETKGWAQSSPFPARLFSDLSFGQVPKKKNATWRWSEPTCQCFRDEIKLLPGLELWSSNFCPVWNLV